jgi:hypothetical protein
MISGLQSSVWNMSVARQPRFARWAGGGDESNPGTSGGPSGASRPSDGELWAGRQIQQNRGGTGSSDNGASESSDGTTTTDDVVKIFLSDVAGLLISGQAEPAGNDPSPVTRGASGNAGASASDPVLTFLYDVRALLAANSTPGTAIDTAATGTPATSGATDSGAVQTSPSDVAPLVAADQTPGTAITGPPSATTPAISGGVAATASDPIQTSPSGIGTTINNQPVAITADTSGGGGATDSGAVRLFLSDVDALLAPNQAPGTVANNSPTSAGSGGQSSLLQMFLSDVAGFLASGQTSGTSSNNMGTTNGAPATSSSTGSAAAVDRQDHFRWNHGDRTIVRGTSISPGSRDGHPSTTVFDRATHIYAGNTRAPVSLSSTV